MKTEHIKKAYFIGIKGAGMSAFAQILKNTGVEVTGSDTHEVFFTDSLLTSSGIPFFRGFAADNLTNSLPVDIIITSPAYIHSDNVEIQEAKKHSIPIVPWQQVLAQMFNDSRGIAICGTHGKSTTTAMLGTILEKAGRDPTVVVGSRVNQWGSNARAGSSEYYVIEACEYRDSFLKYDPKIVAITNIDYDHPSYFTTRERYLESFDTFRNKPSVEKVIETPETISPVPLSVFGEHNQWNANLALEVAREIGIERDIALAALKEFKGLARRCEPYGEYNSALLYDDYAHHPTEITALHNGLREEFPDRAIVFLFQPHTFSRTKKFFDEFVHSLQQPDRAAILYSYSSAQEKEEDDVIGQKLADRLNAPYFSSHEQAIQHFQKTLQPNDLLCCVGAGDGWRIAEALRGLSA